ncbi:MULTISPECIES: 6,7-dimethyl-8-ribityllumazine synthase [Leeuwenhoekiella]|uniref:6,7-dimethyl-8-ribityllumazine synthase n=1 Tax=Leeuwenhoekiella palythoae TaxID=573501 RepID=A0A1M5XIQ7_9FLAO|nr:MULTISPECIES: 6,7-dimethyl-8-ribityllumazine synthase [Leeuwenhoekiella]MAS19819.1 6,7-dimethyl-8-ribityllumazine synthase [Leeuwenhoekiella sp.]MEC7781993.1 6,7-dimethyl-8-ribityllumazine synthase [Bacteroidota bacterium]MEC8885293.1 6,7-dimethyl-8-ribityllumazine synthase [Bacteroidota bacterium]MEE3146441.1 6,7-dimethyl-8-ribityllumazine synthase [Bacteroidota bacterium]MEE3225617.1 6,7-dimethyl-8-ribityllumazine synthase [Bacteroidota bacterium]|tara:strand:- start:398 stop:889 length:492 start_codon:yes stop_codon:yes gene_type:complete
MATTDLSVYDKATIPNAKDFRFGIVVSEWNDKITEGLFQGAFDTFIDCGVKKENIVRWNVPGSFELIYGCKKMQQSYDMLDAVIAVGSVIQGQTKHFDFVCEGVTQGIKDLNIQSDIPVIFCVLTDNTMQQAVDRSGGQHGNKGVEAAVAAIKMAQLRKDARF